jgi:isopenicillin-N epimerase
MSAQFRLRLGRCEDRGIMRGAFLLDPSVRFLNHGSFGACPQEVFDDFQRWQLELERNPVEFLGRRSAALLLAARSTLAASLGADVADLVFVPNATTAVNTVAHSLDLRPGDEVLATDHEYGACDATWQVACTRSGAHYRKVEIPLPFEPARWAERMLAAAGPRTRLIFSSHISSATALVFPVAELCQGARALGIATLIDGAHAPGQIALDLRAIDADYYTGNCHKWMCAPKGAAFLHVRPERQAALESPIVSWGYVAGKLPSSPFDAYTGSSVLERRLQWLGTRDIAAFLAVPAALEFQRRNDWPAWRRRCHAMACETLHRVTTRNGLSSPADDASFGQMVPIPVRTSEAAGLKVRLFDAYRIEVPVTQHAGHAFVRVSVQAYNTQDELDALVSALAAEGV